MNLLVLFSYEQYQSQSSPFNQNVSFESDVIASILKKYYFRNVQIFVMFSPTGHNL